MNQAKRLTTAIISTAELADNEIRDILELGANGKRSLWRDYEAALHSKVIALLFFNPSLRTRASFHSAIARLGGEAVTINAGEDSWSLEFREGAVMSGDKAEHVREACLVLSSYFDAVCVRSFAELNSWAEDSQDRVMDGFRRHLTVPLVSMESALWHPCQALADGLTLTERFGQNLTG